ncbi:MAG: PEP-CTERM sorting domain-containing protein [Rubrivivax sp.]|nr:PEP-CTERM sorting domain-containing protein [Rubrivivax sp.]
MKLRTLAAAAALAMTAPAFADINTIDADAEVFGIVWDPARATYVTDFGIKWGDLVNGTANLKLGSVGGANWEAYVAEDTKNGGSLSDFSEFEGTRWAIFAVDDQGFAFEDGSLNYVTTSAGDLMPKLTNSNIETLTGTMGSSAYVGTLNSNGMGGANDNTDFYAAKGSLGEFDEFIRGGSFGFFAGNAVGGGLVNVFSCTTSGFDFDGAANCTKGNLMVGFDGKDFVAAIPEPGTYAMLAAGLAVVGFMARRRRG